MKSIYPKYEQGSTDKFYNELPKKEKIILDDFLKLCRTTSSEGRERKIKMFVLQLRDITEKPLDKITKKEVIEFLGIVNRSNKSTWTKNDVKKIVKKFLKWYYKDLEMVEGQDIKEAFKTSSMLNAFNYKKINPNTLVQPQELEKLIRTANSLKWKALISFLYESAFRPCELRILKWKDMKFNDDTGFCEISVISPKTKKQRNIIVRDSVIHLKRWREEFQFSDRTQEDYVFPSQYDRNKSLGDGVISEMFKRICNKANMRKIYPYMLRHSRITELRKKGIDMQVTSKFAGHSLEIDELYSHLSNEDVKSSLLSKIYVTKDMSPKEKHELELKVDSLIKYVKEEAVNEIMAKVLQKINNNKIRLQK